ncbi:RuBisCO large subunit C-terminal-like domain-containing protein [Persephonella sp.]|nr:hypothetical protein [Aquificota bacterium]
MNFVEATYLLSSRKKFKAEERVKKYIECIFGGIGGKHFPSISEVEEFYDSDYKLHKALVKIRFPVLMFQHDLYSILSIVYGEIVIPENVKLISVDFPAVFVDHFKGPRFGLRGIRERVNQYHRPLLMAALKPLNGITEEKFVGFLNQVIEGQVDIIREDENFFDDSLFPFEKRVQVVSRILKEKDKNILYLPFLSGSWTEMSEKIKLAQEYEINTFLINLFPLGLEGLQFLSDTFRCGFLVNPGYPSFFYEQDLFGIEPSILYGRFIRMAGGDMVMIPSPYRHRTVPHYRSVEVANVLTERFEDLEPSFPVVYGDMNPEDLYTIFNDFGNQVIIDIGTSYKKFGDITGGVRKFSETLNCVISGVPAEECIKNREQG